MFAEFMVRYTTEERLSLSVIRTNNYGYLFESFRVSTELCVYILRSNWGSTLMYDCSKITIKFSVPAEYIQCRKYKWSILGSSSLNILCRLYTSIIES